MCPSITPGLYLVLCRLFVCLFLSFNFTSYSYENTYMTVQLRDLSTLQGSVVLLAQCRG